jgi:hypothetical protein
MEMFHIRLPVKLIMKFICFSSGRGSWRCCNNFLKSRLPNKSDQVQLRTIRDMCHRNTSGGLKHCPLSGATLKKIVMALTAVDMFADENTDKSGKRKDLGIKIKNSNTTREELPNHSEARNGIKTG